MPLDGGDFHINGHESWLTTKHESLFIPDAERPAARSHAERGNEVRGETFI